ncbi:hypothetical protein CPB86DRAFT_270785 [Serendipita vermifera]|nr:hypothetical protein CPB86DRAFT_270785 [Serendipita vermifera]
MEYHPIDQDDSILLQEIAKNEDLLQQCGQQIQRLELLLARARVAYQNLEEELKHLRIAAAKALSPITRLPPELLSDVALLVCQHGHDRESVAILSLVCRSWNFIIKDTARLRNHIYIDVNNDIMSVEAQCERAEVSIERSKNLGLNVTIHFKNIKSYESCLTEILAQTHPFLIPPSGPELLPSSDSYRRHFSFLYEKAFAKLFGIGGRNIRGWESLKYFGIYKLHNGPAASPNTVQCSQVDEPHSPIRHFNN